MTRLQSDYGLPSLAPSISGGRSFKKKSNWILFFSVLLGIGIMSAMAAKPADESSKTAAAPAAGDSTVTDEEQSLVDKVLAKRAALDDDDLEGRYKLVVWVSKEFDAKKHNFEALELAIDELKSVMSDAPDDPTTRAMTHILENQLKSIQKKADPNLLDLGMTMAFSVIGGLGIFLLGMKYMSEGMQAVAGARLRRMIGMATNNRFAAVFTGVAVTGLIQSSSITTVLVVGFVNSGLMVLHQAIGVIVGANIGTTITGWLLGFKVGKYGLLLLGASAFIYLFTKSERRRYIALTLMGLGMVFFGLELMKNGFAPIRDVPEFHAAFELFKADSYAGLFKCVLIASVLTAIIQSSSATLGIAIALASQGIIDFQTATALVLGMNIGTTITAWLACLGSTTVAKRAAYFHIVFNVIGVVMVYPFFFHYCEVMSYVLQLFGNADPLLIDIEVTPNFGTVMTFSIATSHTIFNVVMTILMIPLVKWWANRLEIWVKEKGPKEVGHLSHLDMRLVESPVIGIEQSRAEILHMGEGVEKMLDWTKELLTQESPDVELKNKVFHREEVMDVVQDEIVHFITEILSGDVPHSVVEEARQQLRITDEYESISDYVAIVLKSHLRLDSANLQPTAEHRETIQQLHQQVADYVALVTDAVKSNQPEVITKAQSQGDSITARVKELRDKHLLEISEKTFDPKQILSYTAQLNAYRKIKDHAKNIAEALGGKK